METIQIFCPAIDLDSGTSSSCMLCIVQGNFMPLKLHLFIESIGFYWKIFSWLAWCWLVCFPEKVCSCGLCIHVLNYPWGGNSVRLFIYIFSNFVGFTVYGSKSSNLCHDYSKQGKTVVLVDEEEPELSESMELADEPNEW